jgi:hypothetical protein
MTLAEFESYKIEGYVAVTDKTSMSIEIMLFHNQEV